jgi:hypothetical protein
VLDIMIALKTCAGNSRYLLPSRYDADAPVSRATFSRVTKKTEPIRWAIDTANDPHEISLDQNVTRENMHPADQFEAFSV